MSEEKSPINIRPINSLLNEKFNIPRYQRGYRWEKTQINELLDDIFDYGRKGKNAGDFYCLQPIVVKRNEKKENGKIWWDLIDGQQRLTTIFIIIKYLQYRYQRTEISLFTIDYETRNNDQNENKGQGCEFLNKINFEPNKEPNAANIDFYHMDMCSIYVEKWFTDHPGADFRIIEMLTSPEAPKNVSVIWYEVDTIEDKSKDQKDQIDVFKRLNYGKIPLTDSELIKAFLLQGDIYQYQEKNVKSQENDVKYIQQRLFEIAKEWDNIEYHLQNDKMWEFLNNKSYNPESRIEYLFKILSEDWNSLLDKKIDVIEHFEYHVFEKYIDMRRGEVKKIETVLDIFDEIKILFSVLDEWYNDRQMYHYIGFLVCQHVKEEKSVKSVKLIKDLYNYFLGKRGKNGERCENGHERPECLEYIKSKIKKIISLEPDQELEKLDYNDKEDYEKLKKIFLFFNVESTIRLESEDTYFPFHLYKKEVPSIEHIHPQTPQDKDKDQIIAWLTSQQLTLPSIINNIIRSNEEKRECEKIQNRIKELLSPQDNDEVFKNEYNKLSRDIDTLYKKLNSITAKKEEEGIPPEIREETDTLSNYALVGDDTNSKLSNNSFQRKREIIINIIAGKEKDPKGEIFNKYIPVCTRNIFQKYYTPQPDNIILWDINDRTEYFKAMKKLYDEFTGKINTGADN